MGTACLVLHSDYAQWIGEGSRRKLKAELEA